MGVARERVQHENGIVFCRGERAPGLVGDGNRAERGTTFQRQLIRWFGEGEKVFFHDPRRSDF